MRRFLFILVPAFTSCVSIGGERKVASVADQPKLNFSKFIKTIKDRRITTVAETLAVLAPEYPDHFKFRTAMYSSESIQEGTFAEPRVIVFGPDAKFVFTFNGGPHQYGGDAIEAFQFDDVKKEFSFYSVGFKKEGKERPFVDEEIEFENNEIYVTKANPSLCLGCHGTIHTGPIWDNDLNWAGVYGSNDDILYGSFHKKNYAGHGNYEYLSDLKYPRSQGRWIDLPERARDLELDGYLSYLAGAPKHERYKHLPPQVFEAGFRKYAQKVPMESIDESEVIKAEGHRLGIEGDQADRVNQFFTLKLVRMAMESLIADIEKNPPLKQLLKNVLAQDPQNERPYYFSAGRLRLVHDWQELVAKIDAPTMKLMEQKIGPFRKHLRTVLKQELELQDVRLARIEKDLNSPVIVPDEWPLPNDMQLNQVIISYEKIMGRKLNRREIMGVKAEAGGLPTLALIGYILKYGGIDMSLYDINSHQYPRGRERVLSFYFGLGHLLEWAESK